MSTFKKVISSVTAFAISATMMTSSVFAAVPNDVVGTEFESSAAVLGVLDIMVGDKDTANFRPNDPIIRSEVTKVGVALMGLLDVAEAHNGPTKYEDVVENHWANGFINVATDQGMVEGDDVGTFRPDSQIKYSEAVAIMVRALGYEPQAEAKGGYPSGYLVTGSSIGLTKDVKASGNDLITRGMVAKMAYNALTINLMEQTGFGSDVSYEVVDKTLLEDVLDVQLISGTVQAVGSSALSGTSSLDNEEIMINDKVYKIGDADVRSILGFYVDAYVKQDSKTKQNTLLLAIPVENMNSSIKVNSDNIDEIVNTESEKSLSYWKDIDKDSKTTKVTISNDAHVVYNGKAASFEDFKAISSGNITLLDSDKNGTYDVVFVNETVNYVVEEVSTTTNKLVDKYGNKTLILDDEDTNMFFRIEKGSEKLSLSDLKEWDVITFTISKDEKLLYGVVTTESVTGTVTEKDDEKVFIDGKGYKVAANYPEKIDLLDEATFYLDAEGKIAAADFENTLSSNYAYLADLGMSSGLDKTLDLKLFTKDGKTVTLSAAKKVKVNQTSNLTAQEAYDKLKANAGQLVTFEVNSDNQVYKINTYKESAGINEDEFKLNLNEKEVVYKSASGKLVGKGMSVNVTDSTVVFDIPADAKDTNDYSVRGKDFFTNNDKYDVMVFDVTEDYNAKAIIVTNSTGNANEESSIAVVDKITKTRYDDGEDVERLYAYQNGEYVSIYTSDDGILVKTQGESTVALKQGDIIQYKTNASGEIDGITVLFDIADKTTEKETNHSDKMTTVYGKVTKKFSNSFNLKVADGTEHNYTIGDAVVYRVDTTKTTKQVTVGDSSDISKFDEANNERVFVRIYDNVVKEIVVVK